MLRNEFEIKDLGPAKKILGIDIKRDKVKGILTLSQSKYIKKILDLYGMTTAKPMNTFIGAYFKLKFVMHELPADEIEYMRCVP